VIFFSELRTCIMKPYLALIALNYVNLGVKIATQTLVRRSIFDNSDARPSVVRSAAVISIAITALAGSDCDMLNGRRIAVWDFLITS
jgi:hypothetical protein